VQLVDPDVVVDAETVATSRAAITPPVLRSTLPGVGAAALLALAGLTRTARADPLPDETSEPPAPSRPAFLDVAFAVGGVSSSSAAFGGGPAIGATGLVRYSPFEAGVSVDAAGELLSPASRVDYGGLVGVGYQEGPSTMGGHLLLEGGARNYEGMGGCSFLCSDPGVSGSVPYLGVRAGATLHPVHKPSTVFVGGLWFFVTRDLASQSQTFSYSGQGLVGPESGTETVAIGGATELGLTLRLGWDTRL
jgi:hypothetical protein